MEIAGSTRCMTTSERDSNSSRISTHDINNILERLKNDMNQSSTNRNYLVIWCSLNNFLVRLDTLPDTWEERVALFGTYLVDYKKVKSTTLQCYISAIKHTLKCDNYKWNDELVWLNSLIRSCKKVNDTVYTRYPIHFKLLELILFEVGRMFKVQPYLETSYKSIFCLAYYGLMRTGEVVVAESGHTIKAKNVFVAANKNKIRIILYTSKTHDKSNRSQEIKISSSESTGKREKFFCPFQLLRSFMKLRGCYNSDEDNLFIFSDGQTPVTQHHVRAVLKDAISALNLNSDLYNFTSFRIGRASDLLKFGFDIETIKRLGRWKSNTVYKYICPV